MKFGVPLHNLVPRLNTLNYQNFANSKWRTTALFVSDYMSAYRSGIQGRRLGVTIGGIAENFFLAMSQRFIDRLTRNLIGRSRVTFRYRSHDQNTKIWKFKKADDRHFENGFITIFQLRIIRVQWNLVCRYIIWFQERSHIKVSKFCKFKMADSRFVCERLYVGLQIWWVLCPPMLIIKQG